MGNFQLKLTWRQICIVLLILGVFFRFYNLGDKVYWYDETQTSLRISGHTRTELVQQVFDGRVISVAELHRQYQYPNADRTLTDTLNALKGSPEHAPGYFLLARFWLQTFGSSVTTIRLLSVLISLLAFPAIYWLSWELWGDRRVAWAAVALIALSPLHVLYAQEARQYSLWAVTILLSSGALLAALRRGTIVPWGIYALTVAASLYTHILSGLVLMSHGIYVLLTSLSSTQTFRKSFLPYLLASLAGALLFAPWLWVMVTGFDRFAENTASVGVRRPLLPLIWALNLSRIFFDLNQGPSLINPVLYLTAALAVYALVVLGRHTPPRVWLFILTLIGVTGLALLVPDIVFGGRRSSITRYVIPCFLGIQLAVAFLLTVKLASEQRRERKYWRYAAIALIFSGILSCGVSAQFPVWWHKSFAKSRYNPQIAEIVNRSDRPLVISDEIHGQVLSLSHLLEPDVQLQLLVEPSVPRVAEGGGDRFLYRPSESLRQGIEQQNYRLEPVFKTWLWKLVR